MEIWFIIYLVIGVMLYGMANKIGLTMVMSSRIYWIPPFLFGFFEFAFMIVAMICGLYFRPYGAADWTVLPLWSIIVISEIAIKTLVVSEIQRNGHQKYITYIVSAFWCICAAMVFYFVFKFTVGSFLFSDVSESGMQLWTIVMSLCMLSAYPYLVYRKCLK